MLKKAAANFTETALGLYMKRPDREGHIVKSLDPKGGNVTELVTKSC